MNFFSTPLNRVWLVYTPYKTFFSETQLPFAVFRRAVHGDRTSQVVMQEPRVGCSREFFGHGINHGKISCVWNCAKRNTLRFDYKNAQVHFCSSILASICPRQGFLRNRIEKANVATFRNNYALNVVAYATLLSIPYNRVKFNIKFSF